MKGNAFTILSLAVASVLGIGSLTQAAVTYSTTAGTAFASGAVIQNALAAGSETNQQQAELIQTFVPTSTFTLGQFSILSGGKAGSAVTVHVYPINVTVTGQGGGNADGYVNTQYSTDLLGGGAGLTATVFGSSGDQIVNFAFSGTDQVTLTSGVEYGFEVDSTSGGFSWERDGGGNYASGNIYQAASGTQKGGVSGNGNDRDGYFAVYATPEPASLGLLGLSGLTLVRRRRA